MVKNLDISNLVDLYGKMLTQKQLQATEFYYNDDLSLSEIADNLGITKQGVRDLIKRAESQLFDLENKLGFYEKALKNKILLQEILKETEKLKKYDNFQEKVKKIEQNVLKILND